MTDEDAFIAALAAAPGDEFTRCVYADWLDDHERYEDAAKQRLMAPGYRALVVQGRVPREIEFGPGKGAMYCFASHFVGGEKLNALCAIPGDWFQAIPVPELYPHLRQSSPEFWRDYHTARQANDAAALAFAMLPLERQDELLAPVEAAT